MKGISLSDWRLYPSRSTGQMAHSWKRKRACSNARTWRWSH